jgi:hypothetical protein
VRITREEKRWQREAQKPIACHSEFQCAAERELRCKQKSGNPRILDIRALAKETEGMSEKFCAVWAFGFRKKMHLDFPRKREKFVRAKR